MYGVSTFRARSMGGGRYLLSAGGCIVHEAAPSKPRSDPRAILARARPRRAAASARSHMTTFITGSHMFTIPTTSPLPGCGFQEGASLAVGSPLVRDELLYFVPAALYSGR